MQAGMRSFPVLTNGAMSETLRRSAVTSNEPPAGNGTTMRTGFDGKACA